MSERTTRDQEVAGLYLQILHQLNTHNVPQWLELDLTFQQMKVLYILKQHGSRKMSELSVDLNVSMPTITGIISRLVDRRDGESLVARVTNLKDRRQVQAHLTEAGLHVIKLIDALNERMLTQALAQLTDGELEDARAGLSHINQALGEQISAPASDSLENVAANLTLVIGEQEAALPTVAIN